MIRLTVLSGAAAAGRIFTDLKTSIKSKLLSYCTNRVIELGLSPKTFQYDFQIGYDRAASRKTIGRLKSLMYKYIMKLMPYVSFCESEFLQITESEKFSVVLNSPYTSSTFDHIDWTQYGYNNTPSNYTIASSNGVSNHCAAMDPNTKWLPRYTRYLNYLFRKYSIPLYATHELSLAFDPVERSDAAALSSVARDKTLIKYMIVSRITFSVVQWSSHNEATHTDIRDGKVEEGSFYSDPEAWDAIGLIGANSSPTCYRYNPVKLFLHLDKGLKILTTLTRKAYYESSAYSFRTANNP